MDKQRRCAPDDSKVTLVKYGRGATARETETHLLTADNLSVFRDGKGLVLALHEYNTEGKCTQTYRLWLSEGDTLRLRSLV